MNEFIVNLKENKKILIAYLKENLDFSGRKVKSMLKSDALTINGKKAYGDSVVRNGDVIKIIEPDKRKDRINPRKMALSILYEDEFLMVVDKPPFIAMHNRKNERDTLANGIRYYFDEKNIDEPVRFYNRLDMNTSGIILIPKDSQTHSLLARRTTADMVKGYSAIVQGIPKDNKGFINKPISSKADEKGRRVTSANGKEAYTEYSVVEVYESSSLLNITIRTGRTHQIRVHLSSIGHPIIGDGLYGEETPLISRQALHASSLKFLHPILNEPMSICSLLPKDIRHLIKKLK